MVGSPQVSWGMMDETRLSEQAVIKSYYVITRETLAHKSMYDNLTGMVIVEEIINAIASKVPKEAKN